MVPRTTSHIEYEIKDSFAIHFWPEKHNSESVTYRLIYNRIILITEGRGEIMVDDQSFTISPNVLFLVAKGQIITIVNGSKFTGYELAFGDTFWDRAPSSANNCKALLFNNASVNQMIPLSRQDIQELALLFKSLLYEYNKEQYINKLDAMAAYLKIIMINIANVNDALVPGFDSHENKTYREFMELVSKWFVTTREVGDYAKQLGISPRKLAGISKRYSGRGAKELIDGQVIAEAKRSLQFSTDAVKEIAFQLNFATPEQFSHFFKKNVQASPQEYRSYFLNSTHKHFAMQ